MLPTIKLVLLQLITTKNKYLGCFKFLFFVVLLTRIKTICSLFTQQFSETEIVDFSFYNFHCNLILPNVKTAFFHSIQLLQLKQAAWLSNLPQDFENLKSTKHWKNTYVQKWWTLKFSRAQVWKTRKVS